MKKSMIALVVMVIALVYISPVSAADPSEFKWVGVTGWKGFPVHLVWGPVDTKHPEGAISGKWVKNPLKDKVVLHLVVYTTNRNREFQLPADGHGVWKHFQAIARMKFDPATLGDWEVPKGTYALYSSNGTLLYKK